MTIYDKVISLTDMQRFYNYQYMYLSIKVHDVESDDFDVEIKK